MNLSKKIAIVQPSVPVYRKELFELLSLIYDIELFCSKKDFCSVDSISAYTGLDLNFHDDFKGFGPFYYIRNFPYKDILTFDLVVTNDNFRVINYIILIIICLLKRKKLIIWNHFKSTKSSSLVTKLRNFISSLASSRLYYTKDEYDHSFIKNKYFLNNTIDLSHSKSLLLNSITRKSIPSKKKGVFFIGRLTEKSNVMFLIKCAILDDSICYHIVGSGPYYNVLHEMIQKNNLTNVKLYGALFSSEEIFNVSSNCFVSIYPGAVGLSCVHYLSLGLPVIVKSGKDNHMPEFSYLKNHYNSFILNSFNPINVVNTINAYFVSEDTLLYNCIKSVYIDLTIESAAINFSKCIDNL